MVYLSGATGCSEKDVFEHISNEVQGHQQLYTQFSTEGVIKSHVNLMKSECSVSTSKDDLSDMLCTILRP